MLAVAGFVAAEEEAAELLGAARGDAARLAGLVSRRLSGEPLAWIVGSVEFCGLSLFVAPGVYVPRWQSEPLARRAAALLPPHGVAVDVCTGAGAVAAVLVAHRPAARVVASDIDPLAVACARENGVEAYLGDLTAPIPAQLRGRVDVISAVVPYVPAEELHLLARDVLAFEGHRSLDGGPGGTRDLVRVATEARKWLAPGGALLLELGGDQGEELRRCCARLGYGDVTLMHDEEGDVRAIEAHLGRSR